MFLQVMEPKTSWNKIQKGKGITNYRNCLCLFGIKLKDILGYIMPKLLLQPLVENSIYHGIKLKKGNGHIKVTGRRKENIVVFKIIDDGVGMDADRLNQIMYASSVSTENYGVGNINDRIKLQYGKEYGLKYYSKPGKGTIVVITLPYETEGGKNNA